MTLSPTALESAAVAALVEMDDRGLLKEVGDDLFDEIKNAVATAAIMAYLAQAGKEGWVMVPLNLARRVTSIARRNEDAPEIHELSTLLAAAQNGGK